MCSAQQAPNAGQEWIMGLETDSRPWNKQQTGGLADL